MEDIRFIREIWGYVERRDPALYTGVVVGNSIYLDLYNGTLIRAMCSPYAVVLRAISKSNGQLDECCVPFSNYFSKKRISKTSPDWCQCIEHGHWRYEDMHPHLAPNPGDYASIAGAIEAYIKLYM